MQQQSFYWHQIPWVSPLVLYRFLREKKKKPILLFSGVTNPEQNGGKYSFLPFEPQKILLYREGSDFLKLLRKNLGRKRKIPMNAPEAFHHFCGGLAGFFSYEFGHEFEQFAWSQKEKKSIPLGFFELFETLCAFDHHKKKAYVGGWFDSSQEAQIFFSHFESNFLTVEGLMTDTSTSVERHVFLPEISQDEYTKAIENIKNELVTGNTYQVNFSQKWTTQTNQDAFTLFSHLVQKNPAPMMFFCEHNDGAVISCTPERLFSLQKDTLFAQPIKGTRRRGEDSREDTQLIQDLLDDAKEKAEHSMIVDLIRNDFGRIAEFGSVEVRNFLRVEKYVTVIHLVSDVYAQLRPEKDALDVVKALFPGGSITGAPKVETMDIISKLEPSSRGVYCGSAGYISFNGNADFNILIRTLQKIGPKLEVRAGGGIVIDSTAEREYEESIEKVMGIIGPLGSIDKESLY